MKKILICAIALFCLTTSTTAQTAKEVQKQRKEIYKMSKEELNQKATKDARKAAKEYKKEGWKAAPGALPLEKQLDRLYLMRMEVDADMYPKYLTGEAMSIAESYDAAKIQAMELARLNLAGQLQSEVTALVENSVGNQQMSREEAASITQTIMESKALFSQNLGRIVPVLECYREKDNKNKEVRVVISYNTEMSTEMAKRLIRQELEKKGEQLRSKFDQIQK